jgi:hypothetical protein
MKNKAILLRLIAVPPSLSDRYHREVSSYRKEG